MTARGAGIAYRVRVLGLRECFVTDRRLVGTDSDGHVYLRGLKRAGLRISDSVALPQMELESGSLEVQIVDRQRDQAVSKALIAQPEATTDLLADMTTSSTTATVRSASSAWSGEVAYIGQEAMLVTTGGATSLSGLTRGVFGTTPQAHKVSTADGTTINPRVYRNRPPTIEGRRVELYEYIEGRDTFGAGEQGTLIWRGVAATDAKLGRDGSTWSFTVDSVWSMLKQSLGADIGGVEGFRGIYYSEAAPFYLWIQEYAGDSATSALAKEQRLRIVGHWESQSEWCVWLTELLDTIATSLAMEVERMEAVPTGDRWALRATIGTTPRYLHIRTFSYLDGDWEVLGQPPSASVVAGQSLRQNVVKEYVDGSATVPRGMLSRTTYPRGIRQADFPRQGKAVGELYDRDRFYLDVTINPDQIDQIYVKGWGSVGSDGENEAQRFVLDSYDAPEGIAFVERDPWRGDFYWTESKKAEVTVTRDIVSGSLADFRDALIAQAPEQSAVGAMPLLTAGDLEDWTDTVAPLVEAYRMLELRQYSIAGEVDLDELLVHEFRFHGVHPYVSGSGAIGLKRLEALTQGAAVDFVITPAEVLFKEQVPTIERTAFGSYNSVVYKTQWDHLEEEHIGRQFKARDVTAVSEQGVFRELEAAPPVGTALYVNTGAPLGWTREDFVGLAQPITGLFGRTYYVVTVAVPRTLYADAIVGNVCSLSINQLPDPTTGLRPITDARGLVVSRDWDLSRGVGVLKILIHAERAFGIAPSVRVSSATSLGSNRWTITVTTMDAFDVLDLLPDNVSIAGVFFVGDEFRVQRWGFADTTAATGTIEAVTAFAPIGHTASMTVQLNSGFNMSLNNPMITWPFATNANERQLQYIFVADQSGVIAGAPAGTQGRVYAV